MGMKKPVKKKIRRSEGGGPGGLRLTIADLVILSLLAERPMHGYEVNATLEDRKIRDWAAVSRPQIYYSLDKLTELGFIRVTVEGSPSAGPERRVLDTTESGRKRLADALEDTHWTSTHVHQPFLTWLALSWQARPRAFQKQLKQRHRFLEQKLAEEQSTLQDVLKEVGHPYHEAVWMLKLATAQIELELKWLEGIERESPKRAPAQRTRKHP
ncbi:MAG TPA: PadR family transcriptional regulator [Pyrinomonadaceae bacterium]|nr:PadR family transcriptional regulator [Pyrinomonadaceae bacterium]